MEDEPLDKSLLQPEQDSGLMSTHLAMIMLSRMMRMKHCGVNPNNTSVADFDNYPRDKPPSSPCEYDNEDHEKQNTKVFYHNSIADNEEIC